MAWHTLLPLFITGQAPCEDAGPWPCEEAGCPSPVVGCAVLRGSCNDLFDKVYKRLGCKGVFPEPYDKVRTEPGLMDLSAEEAAEQADQPQPPSNSSSSNDLSQSWVEISKD